MSDCGSIPHASPIFIFKSFNSMIIVKTRGLLNKILRLYRNFIEKIKHFWKENVMKILLLIGLLSILCIWHQQLLSYTIYIYPITLDKNVAVSWTIAIIATCAIVLYSMRIKKEATIAWNRLLSLLLIVILYLFWKGDYYCYRFSYLTFLRYLDVVYIFIIVEIVHDISLGLKYQRNKRKISSDKYKNLFNHDDPNINNDVLNRNIYALNLVDLIIKDDKHILSSEKDCAGSFSININEKYGVGKSTFMLQMHDYLKTKDAISFFFKPWYCNSREQVIAEFFHLLKSNLRPYLGLFGSKKISSYVLAVIRTLENHYKWNVTKYLFDTDNSVYKKYIAVRTLLNNKIQMPIVVFIDDIDRLNEKELYAVLNLIRNTGDFPHIYYILAFDCDYVCNILGNGIMHLHNPKEFLKKIINCEYLFPATDTLIFDNELINQISEALDLIGLKDKDKDNIIEESLKKELFKRTLINPFNNLRDIKRFGTSLKISIKTLLGDNNAFNDIVISEFIELEILKYLSVDTYKELRSNNVTFLTAKNDRYILTERAKKFIFESDNKQLAQFAPKNKENNSSMPSESSKEYKSFEDLFTFESKMLKEYIYSILQDLFGNEINWCDEKSINKIGAFDKYFMLDLPKNQITYSQFLGLFNSTDIDTRMMNIIENGQEESFIHHLNLILQQISKIEDYRDFLQKMFICLDLIAKNVKKLRIIEPNKFYELQIIYEYKIHYLIYRMFNSEKNNVIDYYVLKGVFSSEDYIYQKLILFSWMQRYHDDISLDKSQIKELSEIVIHTFFLWLEKQKEKFREEIYYAIECARQADVSGQYSLWLTEFAKLFKDHTFEWTIHCVQWDRHIDKFEIEDVFFKKVFANDTYILKRLLTDCENADERATQIELLLEKNDVGNATIEQYPFLEEARYYKGHH